MAIYRLTGLALLVYASFKGSKVLVTLFALKLGASPAQAGLIYAMYSVVPIFIAVYAGRLCDRIGVRVPILLGTAGMAGGLLLPWLQPNLIGLTASALLLGMCYVMFHVPMQSAVGLLPGDRSHNYSTLSLANAGAGFLGPTLAGFSIDASGHAYTYLLAGLVSFTAMACLLLYPGIVPRGRPRSKEEGRAGGTLAMVGAHPALRRILIAGVTTELALELYAFYMPVHGHSIGLSASTIGMIMGTYAVAMVAIRLSSPWLVQRLGEESVLRLAMLVAAGVFCLFPFADETVLLGALAFVLGLSLGCCVPLCMMIIYARAPSGRAGEAIGFRQTINHMTDLGTPIALGSLGAVIGMVPIFRVASALLVAGSTMVSSLRGRVSGGGGKTIAGNA